VALLTKYYSCDKIKEIEVGGACSMCRLRRGAYRVLIRKPQGTGPHRRPCKWDNNILIYLQGIIRSWSGLIWLRRGTGGGILQMGGIS
jgi:hypothetical protein